ncbi:ATP-grasp fold amidoligase family protein [Planococcus koreensis]|uniref:ATP-grasp fold amidoligase family protein n=1 Tax=Planococcus koreensis TaxID=112331 RepID=UPI0039FD0998
MASSKLRKVFANPYIVFHYAASRINLKWLPDLTYLKLMYRARTGEKLNMDEPVTFNEKIQWLKVYDRNPLYPQLVDKYEVRNYISSKIGEDYLIPLIGVYNHVDEIDFGTLPDSFVLKCTHDSGGVVICKDKGSFDLHAAKEKLERHMAINYYWTKREWPYKYVTPKIVCEKYMVDESGLELKDYKIFCFQGVPKMIQVDFDRFQGHKRNLYTPAWQYIAASIEYPTDPDKKINKPQQLDQMLDLAGALSNGFPHVRVDFYSINERVYFGELTFHHGSGIEKFEPGSLEVRMGEWIKIPPDSP